MGSLQKFGDSKMYKIFLFVVSLFLAPSSSRHIFQNRRENSGMANILDTNILKLERELSAASQIAEILEAKKYNKMKSFDLLGGRGLREGVAVRNAPGGTLSITNHLDILRERLLRQIAKNRSKKPDVGQTNSYESGNLVSIG